MGALMQLVAYGAQDVYLTGKPTITFFQAVYQQSTNFAMETIQQTTTGTATNGGKVSVVIARNGDLIGDMFVSLVPQPSLSMTSDNIQPDVNWIAERCISDVTLTIGGQQIDKHYQPWWRLYSELFNSAANKLQYDKMTSSVAAGYATSTTPYRVYLPLIFYFNTNPGCFLPLIALQYHEVRIDFTLSSYFNTFFANSIFEVWGNYVYLDTEERTQFAQNPSQYLITQVQSSNGDTINNLSETSAQQVRLNFNQPVKELVWCYQVPDAATNKNALWNFSTNPAKTQVTVDPKVLKAANAIVRPDTLGAPSVIVTTNSFVNTNATNTYPSSGITLGSWTEEGAPQAGYFETGPLHTFKLVLNNQDRFKEQYGKYFNQVQTFQTHTGNPYPGIYSYSFALRPEDFQPSGTCNFSRIDTAQVYVAIKAATTGTSVIQKMFAVNYNILNVQSGMGGLAFAN